jgi:large subunit ribosomal protein L3
MICSMRAGSIKRWGMARGNMTHGSKSKRQHGSIGMCATPARVFPGLKMAGHMGSVRRKSRKLKVRCMAGSPK